MYNAQLKHFRAMAPSGFVPFKGRHVPNTPLVVELEYRHDDGRSHILKLNKLTGVVYESRTQDQRQALVPAFN